LTNINYIAPRYHPWRFYFYDTAAQRRKIEQKKYLHFLKNFDIIYIENEK